MSNHIIIPVITVKTTLALMSPECYYIQGSMKPSEAVILWYMNSDIMRKKSHRQARLFRKISFSASNVMEYMVWPSCNTYLIITRTVWWTRNFSVMGTTSFMTVICRCLWTCFTCSIYSRLMWKLSAGSELWSTLCGLTPSSPNSWQCVKVSLDKTINP